MKNKKNKKKMKKKKTKRKRKSIKPGDKFILFYLMMCSTPFINDYNALDPSNKTKQYKTETKFKKERYLIRQDNTI